MKLPKILFWNQYFQEKQILGCPGRKHERCNHWKCIAITVLFACQRRRAGNWCNWKHFMKFMKFYENSRILMKLLLFSLFWSDPSGPGRLRNLNIPIGILRFPAGASQGPLRTTKISCCSQIAVNFIKILKNAFETDIFKKNRFWGARGGNMSAATIENA